MDDNKLKFGVGVLVVSAIGIGIILIFLFGAFPSVLNRDYMLTAVFPSAEGIAVNTPVLRDGVRIGRVSGIDLREQGGVLVTMAMDSKYQLPHRYIPQIGSGNLVTGDAKLEFVLAGERQLAEIFGADRQIVSQPYSDGEFLDYGTKSQSLFDLQDDMQETFQAIQTAGESVATAGESVNRLVTEVREILVGSEPLETPPPPVDSGGAAGVAQPLTDVRLTSQVVVAGDRGLAGEIRQTLREFQSLLRDVRSITGDPENLQNLETSLARLPEVLSDVERALESSESVFDSIERAGTQFERVGIAAEETVQTMNSTLSSAGRTIENLEQFTQPLAERGDELVDQAIRSLASLERSLGQVEQLGQALNNNDGSFKLLLEDDELYWQIKRSVENVEMATARIRPILDDVRIFTDKIARDPRQLGVRGALSRRPEGMGLK